MKTTLQWLFTICLFLASQSIYAQQIASKTENPKYVDVLDEDKPLPGQKFTCVSFLSPEKILKTKDLFLFNEFINSEPKTPFCAIIF